MIGERNFLFVLSPNAGILDAWMPILDRLAENPRVKIHALFPRPRATLTMRKDDFLSQQVDRVFSSIHFSDLHGRWRRARSFGAMRFALRVTGRLHKFANRWRGNESGRSQEKPEVDADATIEHFAQSGLVRAEAILCDISECGKPSFAAVLEAAPRSRIFSIAHGIDIRHIAKSAASEESSFPDHLRERIDKLFMLAPSEEVYYRTKFGLSSEQLCLTGVCRHDPEWLARKHKPTVTSGLEPDTYVFLASRPANQTVLPQAEKDRILRMVHEQTVLRGLKLVIRCHPLEGPLSAIESTIGPAGKRGQWLETKLHPLDIGAGAALAITLYSSVAVDMAAIGIPVIDPIDYSRCPSNAPNIHIDGQGRPISFYCQSGIAIGASDKPDFANAFDRLLGQRSALNNTASPAYRRHFQDPTGSVSTATRLILGNVAA